MSDELTIYQMNGMPVNMQAKADASLSSRLARVENVIPYQLRGNTYAAQKRNQFLPLATGGLKSGKLNLAVSNAINFQGIMAPSVVDGQFTIACPSDSSATVYWDGTNSSRVIVIRRADGTTTTVPPNNITITGLAFSNTYTAYPFWTPFNSCGVGWGTGAHGTPLIAVVSTDSDTTAAQAQALQSLAGREPLGIISWTQPGSGGTSSASDPVTNPSRPNCVRLGTHIEVLGSHGKSEVEEAIYPNDKWVHLETDHGLVLECTPEHPLYHEEHGKMEAQLLKEGDNVITRFGVQMLVKSYPFIHGCQKVEVKMKHGHLFWANSFLSHNIKLPQS